MNIEAIYELTGALTCALKAEYIARCAVEDAKGKAEVLSIRVIGGAIAAGDIDGKNADTRKAQKAAILVGNLDYQAALSEIVNTENEAALAEIGRRQVEAVVGLTKAWLYSQSGH